MKFRNFILANVDTDSISFSKRDSSSFTEEEQEALIKEINDQMPEKIKYANDGYFKRAIILRSKNYILYDGKTVKIKGSSLKSATLEPKIKQFLADVINVLVFEQKEIHLQRIKQIYEDYVVQACSIIDIKPWCSKKSITEKTLSSERSNETKLVDAIVDTEYQEGDKVYVFFKKDKTLCLAEDFDGDYDHLKMTEKLYKALLRFQPILPVKETLPNYSLKSKSKVLLENLLAV